MGLVYSYACLSEVERKYDAMINRNWKKYKPLFKCLGFNKEAGQDLIKVFYRLDNDGSRSVDFDEFAKFFDIDNTPYSKKCFMLMDTTGTGEINFAQFVVACWNYCTYDKNGLTGFSFKLYDTSGIGQIPMDDVFTLVEDVYDLDKGMRGFDYSGTVNVVKNSPEYIIGQAKRQVARACGSDKQMNILEFLMFAKTHPSLLKSAFAIQTRLQKKVIGAKYWEKMTEKRRKLEKINGVTGVNFLEFEEVMSWLGEAVPNLLPSFRKKKDPHADKRDKVNHSFQRTSGKRNGKSKGGGKYTVKGGKAHGGKSKLTRKSSVEKIQAWARNIQKKRKHREHRTGKGNSSTKKSRKSTKKKEENSHQLVRKNSATKIQSAMRGWKERKRLEKRKRR